MQTRVALYLRVSLDPTGDQLAVSRQRKDCAALAKARGWIVVREYVDNSVSATAGKRPQWDQMLRDARAGEFDIALAWAADRLVRRLSDLETLIATGVRAATVQGDIDLTTPQGELTATMLAAVARAEVRQKSERQRAANAQRRAAGRPPIGPRPLGWERDGRTLIPAEARAVQGAFEALLSGASLRSISRDLNAAGFRTTRGGEWTAETVGRHMLRNPRYAALNRDESAGDWPAIVDEETWRASVAILRDPARLTNNGDSAVKHLLSNLAICGVCGEEAEVKVKSAWTSSSYGRNPRRIYKCSASAHLGRVAEPIEEFIAGVVVERLSRPDARDLFAPEPVDIRPLRTEATALRSRLDSLAVEFADGSLTASQLRVATERLRARLGEVEAELASASRRSVFGAIAGASDVEAVWAAGDIEARRAWIRALLTVTLLPAGRGARRFDPETVQINWNSTD